MRNIVTDSQTQRIKASNITTEHTWAIPILLFIETFGLHGIYIGLGTFSIQIN